MSAGDKETGETKKIRLSTGSDMKLIDGSILEGGGQILRMSVAFSSLLNSPIKISQIRAGRSKPGLKAQHMTGIKLVQQLCEARTKGCELNSTCVEFVPTKMLKDIKRTEYSVDIGTAGAITLLCQVSLPCLFFSGGHPEVTLNLKGGTNVGMAPLIDYYIHVFKKNLNRFGADFKCKETDIRKGYFPKGGGSIKLQVSPFVRGGFNSITLVQPGDVTKLTIFSSVAGVLPIKMAHAMADGAKSILQQKLLQFQHLKLQKYTCIIILTI